MKGIKNSGFTAAHWQALILRWAAVRRQGPVGPIRTLEPWRDWLPQDLHGSISGFLSHWTFLNGFVRDVVVARSEAALASSPV